MTPPSPSGGHSPDRLDLLVNDVQAHARSLTELTKALAELDKKEAVRDLRDEHLDERLAQIGGRIDGIYRLGWWILAAFGTSAIALVANFAFRGGFIVPS